MTDRRRRLLKHLYKKEERLFMFEQDLPQIIQMKKDVTHKFSAMQLEEFLCSNTKNVAHEVVTCLIAKKGEGVLNFFNNLIQGKALAATSNGRSAAR
jgi:hypothetical protein